MTNRDSHPFWRQISLLDYLQQRGWKIVRDSGQDEVSGLCPLHRENRPSFYVNRRKQVFYCHGCGRGGGLRRLMGWLEEMPAPGPPRQPNAQLLEDTYRFYQEHLRVSVPARSCLAVRGIVDPAIIERMRIGYAPGACLRAHLTRLGYTRLALMEEGLVDGKGRDVFFRCLTFPLIGCGNLYARSLCEGPWRHRFLPRSKGGLYGLERTMGWPRVIVVEGVFDVAALWQAGFDEAVAALGSHLNQRQVAELCRTGKRLTYICFDGDHNGSGQRAARALSMQLRDAGVPALRVALPVGHDPASFFAAGAGVADFQRCLDEARP